MHINVITGGQLDEHLLFWQPTISIILYVIALYPCLHFEMEIEYDDDDDDDDDVRMRNAVVAREIKLSQNYFRGLLQFIEYFPTMSMSLK